MTTIAVLASGRGSNFSAIAAAVRARKLRCDLAVVITDNPAAPVIRRAKRAGVPCVIVARGDFVTKEAFEAALTGVLRQYRISVIVLAGFMRVFTPGFVRSWRAKMINIHPSLLPAFKGATAIRDAYQYGVKVTGVTVHFVDEEVDHGPIILQEAVPVKQGESMAALEKRIHRLEHRLYPEALRLVLAKRVRVRGRKVVRVT